MSKRPSVSLELGRDEAIVLFELLSRLSKADASLLDQAELRVVWDLEAFFEKALVEPLAADYLSIVEAAKRRITSAPHA